MKSKNSIEYCDKLIQFISQHGTPNKITADNGLEFNNQSVKELLKFHKIETHFVTPQHPQSNGMIERLHSTLIEHYRVLKETSSGTPKTLMLYAIIGYNNSIHSATGFPPLELTLGHTVIRDPFDIFINRQYTSQYLEDHKQKIDVIYNKVKEKMLKEKEAIVTRKNKDINEPQFKPGDTVYAKLIVRNKSANKFTGPYKISSIKPNKTCVLLDKNDKKKYSHLDQLKRSIIADGPSTSTQTSQ